MTDKKDEQKEMDDFLAQFENVHDEFDKISSNLGAQETHSDEAPVSVEEEEQDQPRSFRSRKYRGEEEDEGQGPSLLLFFDDLKSKIKSRFYIDREEENPKMSKSTGKLRSKRYKLNLKRLLKTLLFVFAGLFVVGMIYVLSIIFTSPAIDPDNIYSMLSESSVLLDDSQQPVESVFEAEGKRVNIEYKDIPENVINAFVAIEDKTFWKHGGFNYVRLFGAVKDALTTGRISGTSTITQQLARNVYLSDKKSERSISRKVREAYYTVQLERKLSKEQILEAYLNTIFLGYNSYGVQSAAISYYGKDVSELDLFEAVSLAALPQMPDRFALIKALNTEGVTEDTEGILYKGSQYTFVISDLSKDRRDLCLKLMASQGIISEEERHEAINDTLAAHLNPGLDERSELSTYFTDYVITEVIKDLQKDLHLDYNDARQILYTNGLTVYTTMNSKMQGIIEKEFADSGNFPKVSNLRKDGDGNVLGRNGKILLYNFGTYFNDVGNFTLKPEEYITNSDGSVSIIKGNRLNIYNITVKEETDFSLEFKPIYIVEEGVFYNINGGNILIPANYKTRDNEGNLIISKSFFEDHPDFFTFDENGMSIGPEGYSLNQKVIQPQSAMVVTDYKTGQIKAMVGGRITKGRMLFNRATSPRQPGSAIKPMSVYSPALQQAYEAQEAGTSQYFETFDNYGNEIPNFYGDYWTVASVIDDSPLKTGSQVWPKNWYNSYRGLMSLRYAVEQSVNVAAVKVVSQVGFDYSADILEKMGVTTVERQNPQVNDLNPAALGLGGMTNGISPLEMVGGYGTIANSGKYIEPVCYTKIENKRGEVILTKIPKTNQVLNEGVAYVMSDILRSVVTNGLGSPASLPNQPVCGKTGTTTDNYDAWFVGYTPKYAASLWIGNDSSIELSQGSTAASRLWNKIMRQCLANTPRQEFGPAPDNVVYATVDAYSGGLPDGGPTKGEIFVKGTVPSRVIKAYKNVAICVDSGYLATPWCHTVIYKSGTDRGYDVDDVNARANEIPKYYCPIHNGDMSKFPVDPSGQNRYDFEEIEGVEPPVTQEPEPPVTEEPEPPLPKEEEDDKVPSEEAPGWL